MGRGHACRQAVYIIPFLPGLESRLDGCSVEVVDYVLAYGLMSGGLEGISGLIRLARIQLGKLVV